jgi:hypothetical protein
VFQVLLVAGLAVFLAACSGKLQPFSKSNAPKGKSVPPITVTAMNGLPADKAGILFENLVRSAAKRDIAIVQGVFAKGYSMAGGFEALPTASGTTVTYRWTVYNAQKQVIHQIANTDNGRIGGADPWAGVDPDLLRRIADFTAESLATRLNTLGYATRLSGLVPPGSLAKAGPNAGRDIDYETVYGPGSLPPSVAAAPQPVAPKTGTVQKAPVKTARVRRPAQNKKKKTISAVAMTNVSGSPGNGNRDLLLAMRKVMKSAGWPVLSRPRSDALTVTGLVKLYPPAGNQQKVALAWTVKTPDGKVLGTIRQANNVPPGSLNRGWGESATFVSQAAAEGIFKLVKSFK